ncbi:transcription antitermination factor NusB [Niallia circulans]|uniref:Transcription antitermination protein NusB n=1 Tax=Niallia circulans TaxID=1397 RepID=A0A553SKW5_NIACI|nr:transcription antitermination factor NusB [Niallia circulans]TRZ37633.1 transcription antitermination factor NusB [Niallia circulans]
MKRRTAREKALQALFQIDLSEIDKNEAIIHALDGEKPDVYLSALVNGVLDHQVSIDEQISKHLENWTIDRIANVDRNLLRISVYELLYGSEEVPANVVIDEAVEIAKAYGDDKSSKFVNGLLSKIKNSL